jgi:hypothetical protein
MTAKTLLAAVATVAFTVAATAMTVTTAFAAEPTQAATANTTATVAVTSTVADKDTGLTRAQVIAQTIEARKKGLIPETEADFDVAQTKKHFAK